MEKETLKNSIKADNYGELLSQIYGMDLVSFEEDGGYQGEYVCVLKDVENKKLYYFQDYYGSCSGCDWLEAEKDWITGEVPYLKALEYSQQTKPKFIVPEDKPLKITNLGEYMGFEIN